MCCAVVIHVRCVYKLLSIPLLDGSMQEFNSKLCVCVCRDKNDEHISFNCRLRKKKPSNKYNNVKTNFSILISTRGVFHFVQFTSLHRTGGTVTKYICEYICFNVSSVQSAIVVMVYKLCVYYIHCVQTYLNA